MIEIDIIKYILLLPVRITLLPLVIFDSLLYSYQLKNTLGDTLYECWNDILMWFNIRIILYGGD